MSNSHMRSVRFVVATILLSGLAPATPAQEVAPCFSLWPEGELLEVLGDMPCERYVVRDEQFLAVDGQHRVYFPPGWLDSEEKRTVLTRAMRAVSFSLPYYNDLARRHGFAPVTATNLILGVEDYVEISGFYAVVHPVDDILFTEACPILVDARRALSLPLFRLQQVIAHEAFHCLQIKNGFRKYPPTAWWKEGSAEFFSSVLYCRANFEYRFSEVYDNSLPPTGHLELGREYATVIFFQDLANQRGPEWVFRQLFHQPYHADSNEFHDLLAAWPDMPELFHGFAQRFTDNRIIDADDCLEPALRELVFMPRDPNFEPAEVMQITGDGPETVDLEIESFVFDPQPLEFATGKDFDIEVDTNDTIGTASLKPPGSDAAWQPIPDRIRTPCIGDPPVYTLLATSTATLAQSERQRYRLVLRITAHDRDDCATELLNLVPFDCVGRTGGRTLDECLMGTWEMTDESLVQSHFGGPSGADDTELRHSGSVLLAFDGSGTFVKRYGASFNLIKYGAPDLHKMRTNTTTAYDGFVGGCLTSDQMPIGPDYLTLHGELIDDVTVHTTGIRDMLYEIDRTDHGTPWNQWPKLRGAGRITYSCEDDTLTIGKRVYRRNR
jgi:hypothetical protein